MGEAHGRLCRGREGCTACVGGVRTLTARRLEAGLCAARARAPESRCGSHERAERRGRVRQSGAAHARTPFSRPRCDRGGGHCGEMRGGRPGTGVGARCRGPTVAAGPGLISSGCVWSCQRRRHCCRVSFQVVLDFSLRLKQRGVWSLPPGACAGARSARAPASAGARAEGRQPQALLPTRPVT